jgi:hypothetical protein
MASLSTWFSGTIPPFSRNRRATYPRDKVRLRPPETFSRRALLVGIARTLQTRSIPLRRVQRSASLWRRGLHAHETIGEGERRSRLGQRGTGMPERVTPLDGAEYASIGELSFQVGLVRNSIAFIKYCLCFCRCKSPWAHLPLLFSRFLEVQSILKLDSGRDG